VAFLIEHDLEISAPAEVVWEVISDLPRYGEWNPFCIEVRSTLKPGDTIDMRVKLGKRAQFQREFVTDYDAGRGFAYRMKPAPAGALSSRRAHQIRALDAQRCRYQSQFRLQGWLVPLVRGLLGARLQTGFSGMSHAVKQRAEQLWEQRKRAV
jgi:hypothetical protein